MPACPLLEPGGLRIYRIGQPGAGPVWNGPFYLDNHAARTAPPPTRSQSASATIRCLVSSDKVILSSILAAAPGAAICADRPGFGWYIDAMRDRLPQL